MMCTPSAEPALVDTVVGSSGHGGEEGKGKPSVKADPEQGRAA